MFAAHMCRVPSHVSPVCCDCVACCGAAVLEMVVDGQKSWLSFLMLSLWTLSKAAEWVWNFLRNDATGNGIITSTCA